jgi:hypothetical protein
MFGAVDEAMQRLEGLEIRKAGGPNREIEATVVQMG